MFTPSSGYTLGYCDVYQNGVKLVNGDDYTASDGATVTLATGAASGDSIVIVASFPRGLTDGYLKSEADARYPLVTDSSATANGVLYRNGSKALTNGSALVFDGTNLGVGASSPACKVDTNGVIRAQGSTISASGEGLELVYTPSTPWYTGNQGLLQAYNRGGAAYTPLGFSGSTLYFTTGGSGRATLDANGNFGLGVTPASGWQSGRKAMQIGQSMALDCGTTSQAVVRANSYYNGTNDIYINSAASTAYEQTGGTHRWYAASSGTAGNTVSYSQYMMLDASGRLGINTTPTNRPLEIAGAGTLGTQIKITNTGNSAGVQMNGTRTFEIQSTGDSRFIVYDRTAELYRLWIDASGRMNVPYQPAFSAFGNNSNWPVPTASNDPIPYNTMDFDVGSNFNTSTYTFTAPVAGKYYVSFAVLIYPNSIPTGVYITAWASINGASYTGGRAMARMSFKENQTTMGSDGILDLAAGDSVTIRANASGSGCTLYTSTGHAHFNMYLLG